MKISFSNMGSRERIIYEPIMDKKSGSIVVKATGKEDLQDYIQSFAESCDIETIIAKSVHDPSLLQKRQGMFGDFTQMPKTYADMLQRVIDAQNLFDRLPLEARSAFGNDVFKFISSMDDPDWLIRSGLAEKKVDDVVKDAIADVKEVDKIES